MRRWKADVTDSGDIHSLGNGKLVVYEQGPNVVQVVGPPYSSAFFIQLLCSGNGLETVSSREAGTAIWCHDVLQDGKPVGAMVDFVPPRTPCLVRTMRLTSALNSELFAGTASCDENTERYREPAINTGILATINAGAYIYADYPATHRTSYQVIVTGEASVSKSHRENIWRIQCRPGESTIYIIGGPSVVECIEHTESVLRVPKESLLIETRRAWEAFTARRIKFDERIPASFAHKDRLLQVIDDVSVLIKTQQAHEGAVMAGHMYHLGYVRDQYGVSRCLLKLGYVDEAKAILKFYWLIWQRYGVIHNAQGIGADGMFHIHENDDVEITGYLIVQAFDYLHHANDEAFMTEISPMLEWAWEQQKKHLVDGMLPFNGDETYVAGGVLPRSTLNDGAAEATLLFVTGGERLLQWLEHKKLWGTQKIRENRKIVEDAKGKFYANFMAGGILYANNPRRAEIVDLPRFRHGVCEARYSGCLFFGWTEKSKNDRYLCMNCMKYDTLPIADKARYVLQSVSLVPKYVGADVVKADDIARLIESLADQVQKSGRFPSRPDADITVGYDYGLLLYNLVAINHPMAESVFNTMLEVLDETGGWVEYYREGKPAGNRYRPWESGINLEAAIDYALHVGGLMVNAGDLC